MRGYLVGRGWALTKQYCTALECGVTNVTGTFLLLGSDEISKGEKIVVSADLNHWCSDGDSNRWLIAGG